jgi:serine/threonine protein kinase
MKVFRKNVVLEGQDLAYVMLERQVLIESQSNPFIIQLIYAFQNAERLFFLMEVARGGNFYRILLKQTPRPFRYERIVFHSGEIACALSFLHSKHIVCIFFFLLKLNSQFLDRFIVILNLKMFLFLKMVI